MGFHPLTSGQLLDWITLPLPAWQVYYEPGGTLHGDETCSEALRTFKLTADLGRTIRPQDMREDLWLCDCADTDENREIADSIAGVSHFWPYLEKLLASAETPQSRNAAKLRQGQAVRQLRWHMDPSVNPTGRTLSEKLGTLPDEKLGTLPEPYQSLVAAQCDTWRARYVQALSLHTEPYAHGAQDEPVYAVLNPQWLFSASEGTAHVVQLALTVKPLAWYRIGVQGRAANIAFVADRELLRNAGALADPEFEVLGTVQPGDDPAALLRMVSGAYADTDAPLSDILAAARAAAAA